MTGSGLPLSNDRIPVHQGEVLLGYATFRLDGQLELVAEPGLAATREIAREALGRLVRDEWMAWAREQHPELRKRSWLIPWEELTEAEREVDRRIGERLYREARAVLGRAAGLIRYHLQNADISPADRAELAAFADMLDASAPDRA